MTTKPWKLIEQWETTDEWRYMAKWGIYGMKQSKNRFRDVQIVIKNKEGDTFKMRKHAKTFVEWD